VGKNYGKGKHDIKENSERYSILHQQISQRRKKYECALRWNQLFWMEVEKRHEAKFKNRNESNSPSKTSLKKTLPLPDMNEEEDIFEMYKKIKTNNDEIQPDEIGSTISL
jgi:hypothetical protein